MVAAGVNAVGKRGSAGHKAAEGLPMMREESDGHHHVHRAFRSQGSQQDLSFMHHNHDHEDAALLPVLDFVDGSRFHTAIGLLIGANVLVLMTETDYPDWIGWGVVDVVFAVVFLLEIVLRMAHRGIWTFFAKDTWWGVLDVIIVALGVFDALIEPAMKSRGVISSSSGHSSALKFVRLLRLLRIMRLVKLFPKLMSFAQALVEMFSTMVWIFSFLTVIMVCFAIVMAREIGRREAPREGSGVDKETWQTTREYFQDVPTALFTLFRVSTQDDWMTIAGPLVDDNPVWSVFFVGFIVFVSWTMISVLTAVASESMVAATTDRKEQELREAEEKAKAFIEFLREAFKKADSDGNGLLDKEEFETMMKKEFVAEQMRHMGFTMTEEEIVKAWDMLDIDRKGELTIDSFVSGLSYLQEKLTTRHVMNISYSLKRVQRRIEVCVGTLLTELDGVSEQNAAIGQCMDCQDKLREQQQLCVWLWYQWMRKYDPKAVKDANPLRPAKLQAAQAAQETGAMYDI